MRAKASDRVLSMGPEGIRVGSGVEGVTLDSRRVQPGWIFAATIGRHRDGHRFIGEAIARGAVGAVGERPRNEVADQLPTSDFPYIAVSNARRMAGQLAGIVYDRPSRRLQVIGVTGTNGKTSTTHWAAALLNRYLGPSGLVSSVGIQGGSHEEPSGLTTPEGPDLQRHLAGMVGRRCRYAVVEVSSHALEQGRVAGVEFAAGVFTNLSREHLDYHHSMDLYAEAKARLFVALETTGLAVLNQDDPWSDVMRRHCRGRVITVGQQSDAQVRWAPMQDPSTGVVKGVRVHLSSDAIPISLPYPGRHAAANAAIALATAWSLGLRAEMLAGTCVVLPRIPGRWEVFGAPGAPRVIVDYAHTEDALRLVLDTARRVNPEGAIWLVFGARGERDRGKRSGLGRVARQGADHVILTTDSPHSEDPQDVAHDIRKGLGDKPHEIILDRATAIHAAVQRAQPTDLVLVTGRGQEATYHVGEDVRLLDDREVVREALADYVPG